MSSIHIVREYPYPIGTVWRAVTDPDLIPRWTATGAGGRPEGFQPIAGNTFRFVAKPKPGWSGVVSCEVREVDPPHLLRYTWQDAAGGEVSEVTYRLAETEAGTRFTFDHTGLTGVGGFFLAQLLGAVRRKMLTVGLPAVMADINAPASH